MFFPERSEVRVGYREAHQGNFNHIAGPKIFSLAAEIQNLLHFLFSGILTVQYCTILAQTIAKTAKIANFHYT